jgi:hypothetical protein
MLERCASTVFTLIPSAPASSLLRSPLASDRKISSSRGLRSFGVGEGSSGDAKWLRIIVTAPGDRLGLIVLNIFQSQNEITRRFGLQREAIGTGGQGIRRMFRRALQASATILIAGQNRMTPGMTSAASMSGIVTLRSRRSGRRACAFSIVSAPVAASPQIFQFDRSLSMDLMPRRITSISSAIRMRRPVNGGLLRTRLSDFLKSGIPGAEKAIGVYIQAIS